MSDDLDDCIICFNVKWLLERFFHCRLDGSHGLVQAIVLRDVDDSCDFVGHLDNYRTLARLYSQLISLHHPQVEAQGCRDLAGTNGPTQGPWYQGASN